MRRKEPETTETLSLQQRRTNLVTQCKFVASFTYEGRQYNGYPTDAVEAFLKSNPQPADFSVWLQDNWKEIK